MVRKKTGLWSKNATQEPRFYLLTGGERKRLLTGSTARLVVKKGAVKIHNGEEETLLWSKIPRSKASFC